MGEHLATRRDNISMQTQLFFERLAAELLQAAIESEQRRNRIRDLTQACTDATAA